MLVTQSIGHTVLLFSSIPETCGPCPIFRAHICPVVLISLFSGARFRNMSYAFFRVKKTPTSAAIRANGARRTKPHSKAWMATPMTAISRASDRAMSRSESGTDSPVSQRETACWEEGLTHLLRSQQRPAAVRSTA